MDSLRLYKNNKIDQAYELSFEEAFKSFESTTFYNDFQKGWPLSRALNVWIGQDLKSTYDYDESGFERFVDYVLERERKRTV